MAFELAPTPPANEFVTREFVASGTPQDEFPLYLSSCMSCGHVQLPVVVPPERLFRNYVYVSGTSPVFVDHFRTYADEVWSAASLRPDDLVVEIGSNDGTMLRFFKYRGARVLGFDPAASIARTASESGVQTVPDFFNLSTISSVPGRARAVVANNVFAHADDLSEIVSAVSRILADDGVFVFEVSYLVDVVRENLFDTIYHEHLSYHHLGSLVPFFRRLGLEVFDAKRVKTHGGSVRVYVGRPGRGLSASATGLLAEEASLGFSTPSGCHGLPCQPLLDLWGKIESLRSSLRGLLSSVRSSGGRVAGFGAPAKVTTLMHAFGLGRDDFEFIVDDSALKQGLYTPGKFVPVLPPSALYERRPDYCVVLAWNFADSIVEKHKRFSDEGGRFIIPIPELRVL